MREDDIPIPAELEMGDRSNGNSTSFTTCNGNGNQNGGCSQLSNKDEEDYELEIVTAVADFCAIDDSQVSSISFLLSHMLKLTFVEL